VLPWPTRAHKPTREAAIAAFRRRAGGGNSPALPLIGQGRWLQKERPRGEATRMRGLLEHPGSPEGAPG
jgi:hypothetical protein